MIVFVQIGNSDNKLTQQQWSKFTSTTADSCKALSSFFIGEWYSLPNAPWQNACWMIKIEDEHNIETLREELRGLCVVYNQDSIAWTQAEATEFLSYKDE